MDVSSRNVWLPENKMNVIVKAAHCIRKDVYKREMIRETLKGAALSKSSLKKLAFEALCYDDDCEYWNKHEYVIHDNVFDGIYPLCTENDAWLLKHSLLCSRTFREFRSEVALSVAPCMKVGTFKSSLKAQPWIPKDRLLVVREGESCPLEDDSSTLDACGIEDGVSVLVCMGGSFPVTVVDIDPLDDEEFVIPISSCFETVGDLKKKIHKRTGKDPDDLCMLHQNLTISKNDDIPLLAHGIVKRYWDMQKDWNLQEENMEKADIPNCIELFSDRNYSSNVTKYYTMAMRNMMEHTGREHEGTSQWQREHN